MDCVYIGQAQQEGSPPGANQEAKSKQEEGRESARPSRPAVRNASHPKCHHTHTHVHTHAHAFCLDSPLWKSPSPLFFSAIHRQPLLHFFLFVPLFLQSYKKAVDEVSSL